MPHALSHGCVVYYSAGVILSILYRVVYFPKWIKHYVMPLFHWTVMPLCSYGIQQNEQICSRIAEMVWWNNSGATILHVLRINCISMAHGWRICSVHGAWMAMLLHMTSHMRTWSLCIHGARGACTAYSSCMHGDQRNSMVNAGHMYNAWLHTCLTYKYTPFFDKGNLE